MIYKVLSFDILLLEKINNAISNSFLEDFFCFITRQFILIIILIVFGYYVNLKVGLKKVVLFFALIGGTVVISEGSSQISKHTFKRQRPCHNPIIKEKINAYCGCGSRYGFYSGHAVNSAAITSALILVPLAPNYLKIFLVVIAFLHSFSRVAIGVHYPLDVLVGWIIGIFIGCISGTFIRKWIK